MDARVLRGAAAAGDRRVFNFLEAEGVERIREAYPEPTYRRLAEIKRHFDPTNLFRLNQNIVPAASVA